eukprot:5800998-Lingulodinium_polyedra.AAC.1
MFQWFVAAQWPAMATRRPRLLLNLRWVAVASPLCGHCLAMAWPFESPAVGRPVAPAARAARFA